MFITFEGVEGAGKSTQARLLSEKLAEAGYRVFLTREPGGTPLASAVRALLLQPEASVEALARAQLLAREDGAAAAEPMLPETELLLLSAARAQHVARIREALAEGTLVVSDRFADATRAYQGAGRGLDSDLITSLEGIATGGLRPDLTFLFDLPVAEGLRRKHVQGQMQAEEWNRIDAEEQAFHERVREGYLTLAAAEPARWVVLDATLPSEQLTDQVWQSVRERVA